MPGKRSTRPKVVGLDVFAALPLVGLKRAGFQPVVNLEHSTYGVKTARLNHPEVEIRTDREWGDLTEFFMADFIFSQPPCAPWSSASKSFTEGRDGKVDMKGRESWRDDARLEWITHNVEVSRSLQPKTWLWESVHNAWKNGQEFVLEQARAWAEDDYSVSVLLQNNKWLGANQRRPRMMLIAHQYPLIWPEFVHPRTTGELLAEVPVVESEKRWLKPFMKELWELSPKVGGSLSRVVRDGLIVRHPEDKVPSFLCRRAKWEEVPNIFMSDSTRLHPTEPRHYTWGEMLAICDLPPDWRAACSIAAASMELARTVLPHAAEWVGRAVLNGLNTKPLTTPEYMVYNFLDAYNPFSEALAL